MDRQDIIFIDVEASGLHKGSYPIEVGWAFLDLRSESFLIRPAENWDEYDWSVQSEKIHGISRAECIRDGLDTWAAARRLNELFAGKAVFSDAPEFDGSWLARLFDATGIEPSFPLRLLDAAHLLRGALEDRVVDNRDLEALERQVKSRFPRSHRAAADALYLAALYRSVSEPGFLDGLGDGQ